MKYFAIALALIAGAALLSTPALADSSNSAAAHVICNVVPNVAINPNTPQVVVSAIQSDEFDVEVEFQVQANTQVLELSVQASSLFKHDDPNSPYFIPLMSGSETVDVTIQSGSPLGGLNNKLSFVGPAASPIEVAGRSYPASTTDTKQYGSGQGEFWNQWTKVTVGYDQAVETLPTGEYSGGIQLTAVVVPTP
jgi:hypothetical protein